MPASPADALDIARKLPLGSDPAVDAFSAEKARLTGIDPSIQDSPFKGLPRYPIEYHSRRFVIGNEQGINGDGKKTLDPADEKDHEDFTRIMQGKYTGETIVEKYEHTFLQDGTVVVWLEWLTQKDAPAIQRPPHARTAAELLDPRVPPASEGAVPPTAKEPPAKSAQGSDAPVTPEDEGRFFGEDGPSHEDEPDF